MKLSSFSAWLGGLFALGHIVSNVVTAFEISAGFAFSESLLPELMTAGTTGIVLLLPALVLWRAKPFTSLWEKLSLLYPLVLGLGLANVHFIADDPLAAGLPMVVIVMPFLIVFSILLFAFGRKRAKFSFAPKFK